MRVSNGAGNAEFDLRAGIQLAPHIQAPAYKFGAFAHAVQAVMSGLPVLGQNLWVDAFSVVPNAHPEMPVIEVFIVPSTEVPGGIGEPSTALAAGSLVNAVYAATGKRIYRLPIKPEALTPKATA